MRAGAVRRAGASTNRPAQAIADYDRALSSGVLKVASKMGVSTLQAYQSAQLFEAVGLDAALVDAYFTNTPHCLGGAGLSRIEADSRYHHDRAFLGPIGGGALPSVGRHRLRTGEGAEEHLYSPEVIHTLQQALWNDDRALFDRYAAMVEERRPAHHPLAADLPLRVLQGRAAGGSRAGGEHRAALQDRGHVLRLHLAGGARVSWRWP